VVTYQEPVTVGDGIFADADRHVLNCQQLAVCDVDNNGLQDLILMEAVGQNDVSGTFSNNYNQLSRLEFVNQTPGELDILSLDIGLLNYVGFPLFVFDPIHEFEARDINGDGLHDLMFSFSYDASEWAAALYNTGGNFSQAVMCPGDYFMEAHTQLSNADGDAQLEVLRSYYNSVSIFNMPSGIPSAQINLSSQYITLDDQLGLFFMPNSRVIVADLWSDDLQDLIFVSNSGSLSFATNDGNGSYLEVNPDDPFGMLSLNLFDTGIAEIWDVDVADMNGDGADDLVLLNNNFVYILLGNSSSTPNVNYPAMISTFMDTNANGVMDGSEYLLTNVPLELSSGQFYYNSVGRSEITMNAGSLGFTPLNNHPNFLWQPESLTANFDEATDTMFLAFGLRPIGSLDSVSAWAFSSNNCENSYYEITVSNEGNSILSGDLEVVLDANYTFISSVGLLPSAVSGNNLHFVIENLQPFAPLHVLVRCTNPGAPILGQYSNCSFTLTMHNADGVSLDPITESHTTLYACAYDPNYKEVEEGYTENNYVLDGTWLNYTVHFQNTGNAPASLVYIEDQLSADLDWSTLQPLNGSHDFTTTLSDNGMVEFRFENINLPDSTSDLEGSQGYVSYRIKLRDGLNAFTEVANTAAIYFDANEPIITNTTVNTIYYCSDLEQNEVVLQPLCANATFEGTNNATWVESIGWSYQAQTSTSESFVFSATESAPLVVELSNALCQYTESWNVEVDTPVASFTINGNTLTASEGASYEWFVMNGETVSSTGITTQSFEVTQSGMYAVLVTNANGCSAYSSYQTIEISSVSEKGEEALVVYPNPARDMLVVALKSSDYGKIMLIVDCTGRVVLTEGTITKNQIQLDVSSLSAGIYAVCFGEHKALFVKE
jgi:hypothetical protein